MRQAFVPILALAILALILHYLSGWLLAIWFWMATVLVAFFYRDPRREIPSIPLAVLSPIDGRVVAVSEVRDPFCDRLAIRIQMQSSLWGVFTVRSPIEGKVTKQWFGTLPDPNDEGIYAATHIPTFSQWVQTDEGDDVVTTMTPRFSRNGARCYVSSGERIGQGKRCGFVPFGADAETFVAANSRIDVNPGDKVTAGTTVIATLIR